MLLFTDPACGPCTALIPEVARWQGDHARALSFALISTGTIDENRAKAREHGVEALYIQDERAISAAYEVNGTPSAVVVEPDGTVRRPVAAGADDIRSLLTAVTGAPRAPQIVEMPAEAPAAIRAMAAAPAVGAEAPRRRMQGLRGRSVNLAPGSAATLLVFWNPECGFCERLRGGSRGVGARAAQDRPAARADLRRRRGAQRTLPFRAPVVFDPDSSLMREFGAAGTPSALLVDGRGKVASELAVGGPAVLALTGRQHAEPALAG
ncbi:MAG: hypothetical protein ACJ77Z_21410 [Thermoleophilaceae bacterium]